MGSLEIRVERGIAILEFLQQRQPLRRHRGHALETGDEIIGQHLVTMHVEAEFDAGLDHALADMEHFRAALQAGVLPFAVQIGARCVGPQISAPAAIRVHVRNDIEHGAFQQRAGRRVRRVEQPVEEALDPPFGHGLAGMLARDHPKGRLALARLANLQDVDILPVQRPARHLQRDQRRGQRIGHQIGVALHRIGREIGVIDRIRGRHMLDGHDLAVEPGRHAEPVLPVIGGDGVIILEAARIGHIAGILDDQCQRPAPCPGDAEVEPLREVRRIVLADAQAGGGVLQGDNLDVAAIEGAADCDHGKPDGLRNSGRKHGNGTNPTLPQTQSQCRLFRDGLIRDGRLRDEASCPLHIGHPRRQSMAVAHKATI